MEQFHHGPVLINAGAAWHQGITLSIQQVGVSRSFSTRILFLGKFLICMWWTDGWMDVIISFFSFVSLELFKCYFKLIRPISLKKQRWQGWQGQVFPGRKWGLTVQPCVRLATFEVQVSDQHFCIKSMFYESFKALIWLVAIKQIRTHCSVCFVFFCRYLPSESQDAAAASASQSDLLMGEPTPGQARYVL